jgi:hypothetical protein
VADVRKISVSMPPDVVEAAKQAARAAEISLSAWITQAVHAGLKEQARLAIGRMEAEKLIAEYEAENGLIPQEVYDEVDAFLAGPGAQPIRRAG